MDQIGLWLGTVVMGLGAALLIGKRINAPKETEGFHTLVALVTTIAALSYLAMALHLGVSTINGREIYWARYVDWIVTTPMLLINLGYLARVAKRTVAWWVFLDGSMIVVGMVGALSAKPMSYILWGVSSIFFVVLLVSLLRSFSTAVLVLPVEVYTLFHDLTTMTILLWIAYPIVWIFGIEGNQLIPLGVEILLFAALDVSAKVGFGYLLLRDHTVLLPIRIKPDVALASASYGD